jgi:xanthine/CO dehydrogenase XdhC/CoxF family maturation factor
MTPKEAIDFAKALKELWQNRQSVVVATVIAVTGSAYRRQGAKLLLAEDGTTLGQVSGGCFEPELARLATEVLQTQKPKTVYYDLGDESIFGYLVGCPGNIEVHLQSWQMDGALTAWLASIEKRQKGVLVIDLKAGHHAFWDGQQWIGQTPEPIHFTTWPKQPHIMETARGRYFIDPLPEFPKLAIFGGGFDAVPLAQGAIHLGFTVHVIDPRDIYANAKRFPDAIVHVIQPQEAIHLLDEETFVVIMNHHLVRDEASLDLALRHNVRYIGALGPKKRWETIFTKLGLQEIPINIFNPVGLDIGAESAEEIAHAIIGEIIAVSRGHQGGFLKHGGKIH